MEIDKNKVVDSKGKVNPMLKHFFFSAFRSKKEYRKLAKVYGKLMKAIIDLTPTTGTLHLSFEQKGKATILTAKKINETVISQKENEGLVITESKQPFSEEERQQFLKNFKVTKEQMDGLKRAFILLDFDKKGAIVSLISKDGSKQNITF